MGVLACDRSGCPNVMCDRLILNNRRYICGDCWGELLKWKETWELPMTEWEVENKILDFFDTVPKSTIPIEEHHDIEAVFRRLTNQD